MKKPHLLLALCLSFSLLAGCAAEQSVNPRQAVYESYLSCISWTQGLPMVLYDYAQEEFQRGMYPDERLQAMAAEAFEGSTLDTNEKITDYACALCPALKECGPAAGCKCQ